MVAGSDHAAIIQYGYAGGELSFVVFTLSSEKVEAGVIGAVRAGGDLHGRVRACLLTPDGKKVELPCRDSQLMEVRDGSLRFSQERITAREFEAFLARPDAERTLDGLLSFVKEYRTRPGPSKPGK